MFKSSHVWLCMTWKLYDDEFSGMTKYLEWRIFGNDKFQEWQIFENDEFSRMMNFRERRIFREWQIFRNDEFSRMTNFREWQIFGKDKFSGMLNFWEEFFWPLIFYPLRALGSEYLRSHSGWDWFIMHVKLGHSMDNGFISKKINKN